MTPRLVWVLWQDGRRIRFPLGKVGIAWRAHRAAVRLYVDGRCANPPTLYVALDRGKR